MAGNLPLALCLLSSSSYILVLENKVSETKNTLILSQSNLSFSVNPNPLCPLCSAELCGWFFRCVVELPYPKHKKACISRLESWGD